MIGMMKNSIIARLSQEHVIIQTQHPHGCPMRDPYTNMRYVGVIIDPLGLEVPVYYNADIDPEGLHTLSSISGYMKVESQRFNIVDKTWSVVESRIQNVPHTRPERQIDRRIPAFEGLGL